jgi:hypothetical protein
VEGMWDMKRRLHQSMEKGQKGKTNRPSYKYVCTLIHFLSSYGSARLVTNLALRGGAPGRRVAPLNTVDTQSSTIGVYLRSGECCGMQLGRRTNGGK